jgi:baculoviral IAP repeat-containing protein 6
MNESLGNHLSLMLIFQDLKKQADLISKSPEEYCDMYSEDSETISMLSLCMNIEETVDTLSRFAKNLNFIPYGTISLEQKEEVKSDLDAQKSSNIPAFKAVTFSNFQQKNYFEKYGTSNIFNKKRLLRIRSEIASLQNNLPSGIFLLVDEERCDLMRFLIIGPENTPYEYGLFQFDMYIPAEYPTSPPKVHFLTTGNGRFRFNPNLYDSGKVCLSLLGTWHGHESEQWNAKTSTILQLLISIQSLIFCEKPYFNEPGYESTYNSEQGKFRSDEYNKQIQYNSIDLAIIEQINNPIEDFKDDIYTHFNFKRNEIINTFNKWLKTNKSLENLRDRLLDALNRVKI